MEGKSDAGEPAAVHPEAGSVVSDIAHGLRVYRAVRAVLERFCDTGGDVARAYRGLVVANVVTVVVLECCIWAAVAVGGDGLPGWFDAAVWTVRVTVVCVAMWKSEGYYSTIASVYAQLKYPGIRGGMGLLSRVGFYCAVQLVVLASACVRLIPYAGWLVSACLSGLAYGVYAYHMKLRAVGGMSALMQAQFFDRNAGFFFGLGVPVAAVTGVLGLEAGNAAYALLFPIVIGVAFEEDPGQRGAARVPIMELMVRAVNACAGWLDGN